MNLLRPFAAALAALACCAAAQAQPYSTADQERRARNREEVMAKYQGQRTTSYRPATARAKAKPAGRSAGTVANVKAKTQRAATATSDFTHRQAQKSRDFTDRQNRAFAAKEAKRQAAQR